MSAAAPNGLQYRSDSSESDEGFDTSFVEFSSCVEKVKIFNDIVHPHLELPSLCSKIINTPQFQRLRNLKQLGLCYYVYPSAAHNRFEHCVGTSYLAGKYVKILRKNQPELNITDEDVLCLYIAGLCHDIGHGPFSHTWEKFIHKLGNKKYSHEDMSLKMLDYLIEDNNLKRYFEAEQLNDRDILFIKELILGRPLEKNQQFVGRKPCKHFLYQIVANGVTKIDVDKFDYLLRDCKQLNVTTVFDYQRLLDNTRVIGYENKEVREVIEENTPTTIVYRKKISETLEDLFRSRFSMHQKAYQHRVTKLIEEMVMDGLVAAEPHFKVPGKDGTVYTLSTAYQDPSAFMKLTDSILESVIHWGTGGSQAAEIFNRVVYRKLYTFLGYVSGIVKEDALKDLQSKDSNIRLIPTEINYGSGRHNPLNDVMFFEKARPTQITTKRFPDAPQEIRVFIVYCTPGLESVMEENNTNNRINIEPEVKVQIIKKEVKNWSDKYGITLEFE